METNKPRISPLTFAYLFGTMPLVAGCGIFLLSCATNSEWLQAAGMLNIFLGFIAFLIGIGCLVVHFAGAIQQRPIDWRGVVWAIPAVAIMLANFPVCGVIVDTVFRLQNAQDVANRLRQSTIRVVNAGEAKVESVVVGGVRYDGERELGPILHGEGASLFFRRSRKTTAHT